MVLRELLRGVLDTEARLGTRLRYRGLREILSAALTAIFHVALL